MKIISFHYSYSQKSCIGKYKDGHAKQSGVWGSDGENKGVFWRKSIKNKPDDVTELYESDKNAILNLDTDIRIKPQKWYVSFKRQITIYVQWDSGKHIEDDY